MLLQPMALGIVRGCSVALVAPLMLVLLVMLLTAFFKSPFQDVLAGNDRTQWAGAPDVAASGAIAVVWMVAILATAGGLVWLVRRQFGTRPLLPAAKEYIDGRPFVAARLPAPQFEWVHVEQREEISKAVHDQIVDDQHRAAMLREAQAQTAAARAAAEHQRRAANAQVAAANAARSAAMRDRHEPEHRFQVRGVGDTLPSHYIEEI